MDIQKYIYLPDQILFWQNTTGPNAEQESGAHTHYKEQLMCYAVPLGKPRVFLGHHPLGPSHCFPYK